MGVGKSQKLFYFVWIKMSPGTQPKRVAEYFLTKEHAQVMADFTERMVPTAKTWVECDVLNLEDDQRSKVL